jgi:hypothetical protein
MSLRGRMMAKGTLERAFELAPECRSISELRTRLKTEGHENVEAHITGSAMKQLAKLLARF